MATTISGPEPIAGRAQPPIYPLIVGNNGGFMAVRSSPAQGACGVGSYPCKHPGVDVNGAPGTAVKAPEAGTIVFASAGVAPLGGYGPWAVIIAGRSGVFHLLAHLATSTASMGAVGREVQAGDVVGTVSSAYHTHWEVRKRAIPDFASGETNATNNLDPLAWLSDRQGAGALIPLLMIGASATLLYLLWRE